GALAVLVHLCAHGLVYEMGLELDPEDRLVERDVLGALRAEHGCCRSSHYFDSTLTSMRPFFGPGTAPLISSRLRSVSTAWTVRPTCVARLFPIWPAIFLPLK